MEPLLVPNLSDEATPLPVIAVEDAVASARTGDAFTVDSDGSDLRYRARAFVDRRSNVVVVLALPLESVDNAISDLVAVEAAGAAAIVAALVLVAWWVIHLGVRPINRMTEVATAIADGDLSHRVPDADPRTEAGALGGALNQMLGHIEAAFDERTQSEARLRQFVADASHELRTPVATIRGYAELYRRGGLAAETERADALRRTEEEAVRMGTLVDDLLQLARLDQGRPLEMAPVDLSHVVADAAADAHAVDPGRPITTVAGSPVVVSGDEGRLRQVVANIVGNALVHTPPGTAIELRSFVEGDVGIVEVVDRGPGMPEGVEARAFERFYRADPARSRHQGGSGLGLAIVDATVRAHSGTASIESTPGEGTTVRITLPAVSRGA